MALGMTQGNMGIGVLGHPYARLKRSFRWMFKISGICGVEPMTGIHVLPPSASARPKIGFKEAEAQHLSETIYYPVKPDWKPINLKLYDLRLENNPIIDWLKEIYDVEQGLWTSSRDMRDSADESQLGLKRDASLELYDGCGNVLETWTYENAYPMDIDFAQLNMGSSEVLTIDLTLRYDRAYVKVDTSCGSLSFIDPLNPKSFLTS